MTLKTLREDLLEAENDLQHAWDSHQIELCEKVIAIPQIFITETSSQ